MNQRACHARRFASRWPIPCYTPPPPLSHKQLNGLSKSIVISEVGSLCASGSGSSHAQSLLTMTTVVARAMKTPDRHTCCGKKEQQVRRSPLRCGFATSTLRSCCALTPSPASPHEPRRTSSARLMQNAPVLTHLPCGTRTASTLDAGLCAGSPRQVGVPRCRASGFVTASGEGRREKRLSLTKARTQ